MTEEIKEQIIINSKEKEKNEENKENLIKKTKNDKNSENFQESETSLTNSMKMEISRLKENLSKSQLKVNELLEENNRLKVMQLDNGKKLLIKGDIINSNKAEINRLQQRNSTLETENDSHNKNIQELNYKIIELEQKLESNDKLNQIIQKLKDNTEDKTKEKEYVLELNELYNRINEIEIKNAKLIFDNKNLSNKLEFQNKEQKTDIEIIESINKKKVENLEKTILNLTNTINELINEKKGPKEINYNNSIEKEMYKNISELEQKIRNYDNDNYNLKKKNQKLINENEELKIILKGKENIVDKLQENINIIENDFKQKLSELNIDFKSPNIVNKKEELPDVNNIINDNQTIENLINEQKRLTEENEVLKNNYEQMTMGINEANELFLNKQKEYENMINYQNEKLKEYKFKISLLKIKIKELHSEIGFLQDKQLKRNINNNGNKFYQPLNENFFSTLEKEQQSIEFNFTPEQIKIMNSYNTPPNNLDANINYQINNLNAEEK